MSNIVVKFIGKEYSFPVDLLAYLDFIKITEEIKANVFRDFLRKLSDSETPCVNDNEMRNEIERQVGRLIAKLIDNGIYDRTINDYLQKNRGYSLISDVNKDALKEAARALSQQMSDLLDGYEDAVRKKDASVTGLGFSIWSSSFIDHAVYAAMDASSVSAQEKAAAREYEKDMAELNARIDHRKDDNERRYIADIYKPHMEVAITEFAYGLLDTFVSDLIEYDKLDKDVLKYIHINRSNDLLKNLELSQNKEAILHKAFEACPYNLQVYKKALEHNLLDLDSYQTALRFKQGASILAFLMEKLEKIEYPNKFHIKYDIASQIAEFTNNDFVDFLKEWTKDYASKIVIAYAKVNDFLTDDSLCYRMFLKIDKKSLLSDDSLCKNKAYECINSIVSIEVWEQLTTRCGHIDLLCRIEECFQLSDEKKSKEELDKYLTEQLTLAFEKARHRVIVQRKQEEERQQIELEKQRAEQAKQEQEHRKRVKRIVTIVIPIIVAIVLFVVVLNKVTSTIQSDTKTNIDYASDFLGREFDSDGSISVSDDECAFLDNGSTLWGIKGHYELGVSYVGQVNFTLDLIDWTSDVSVDNFDTIMNGLKKLYGPIDVINPDEFYDSDYDYDTVYMWEDVDQYSHVLCWQNNDGSATIRWKISL